MTRLWNEPLEFADEMVDGFVRANGRWVRRVPGGVARSTQEADPTVSVVIGGGSGHYPAFAGLVGPGLAHGAAMGNLFASPSAHQVESVARAVDHGQGVLFSYGNYAGDVLHFNAAQESLRSAGVDCRTVTVTDDIFSAQPHERHKRRGIAGDLTVFKTTGGAAASGYSLDDVERVATLANERTRSMGVAFTGCTLPGADEPLFTVPAGRMAIGLGIHGEPGIDETDIPTANELAELFVDRLLDPAEIPEGVTVSGARVVPLLNGLGSVKNEELFVVYRRVAELLESRGLTVIDPHVGEYCTSFDMAGVSLTLFWPTEELERLWSAPADTPAYRTGNVDASTLTTVTAQDAAESDVLPEADDASSAVAARIAKLLAVVRDVVDENVDELGRIDAIAGDGDHGIGMQRGTIAAAAAAAALAEKRAGAASLLTRSADAWSDRAGGTSGALWGLMLRTLGRHLGDTGSPEAASISVGVSAAVAAVMEHGKAKPGDKTMVDALVPFADHLSRAIEGGAGLAEGWADAARAATLAADASADLMPGMGRARSHGERALGVPDPGAVSFALIATRLSAELTA